eukprot:8779421-Ditylum_brightwellii.AAC.1
MDCFEEKKPSTDTLEKFNVVCLYLGVLTVADITNDEERHIIQWALSGSLRAKVLLPWSNQGKPSD